MTKRNTPARSSQKHLSPGLIEQYLFGQLPDRSRHRVERHLLECELCSEAVEGLSGQPDPTRTLLHLNELRSRLDKRVSRRRFVIPFGLQPYAVAASIILLVTCTLVVWLGLQWWGEPAGNRAETTSQSPAQPVPPQTDDAGQLAAAKPQLKPASPTAASVDRVDSGAVAQLQDSVDLAKSRLAFVPSASAQKAKRVHSPTAPISSANSPVLLAEEVDLAIADRAEERQAANLKDAPDNAVARSKGLYDANKPAANRSVLPALSPSAFFTITGKVVDASDGEAIPGVNITVKGTTIGAATDPQGNFSLNIPSDSVELVFNFIGMTTQEKPVGKSRFFRIALEPDVQALSEVVVVGYGDREEKGIVNFKQARPVGGMDLYNRYIKENLRRPDPAKSEKKVAVVKVECIVQPDGQLTNFTIRKGAGAAFNKEAIRVLQQGPAWQPAQQDGKPVPSKVTVRVPFEE